MNCYGCKELARSFRTVRQNTIQIAEEIPETKYAFQAAPELRPIGKLLVHVALVPTIQYEIHANKISDLANFDFFGLVQKLMAEEAKPRTKAETIALLTSEGEKFAAYLEGLSDAFLAEQVAQPPHLQPASKSRFEMLLSPKEHEMHHRGQLMTMQRMIGQVPHLTRRMQEAFAAAQQQAQR